MSVIDWDESVYLLMGRDILQGRLPYQGSFDHKPAVLYYHFAAAQLVFGHSVYAIRLLAITACSMTALLIGLYLRKATSAGAFSAITAAVLYALLSAHNGGLATNTEILLNVYVMLALVFVQNRALLTSFRPGQSFALGFVLGLMFHTNYLSAIPIAGIGAAYFYACVMRAGWSRAVALCLRNGIVIALGFIGATALILLPIVIWSDIGDYFGRQMEYLATYRAPVPFFESVKRIVSALLPYGLLLTFVLAALLPARARAEFTEDKKIAATQMLIYLVAAFLACIVSGRVFPHYFMLLLPGLCILAGILLTNIAEGAASRRVIGIWMILLAVLSLSIERWTYDKGLVACKAWLRNEPPDLTAKVAHDLRSRMQPGDVMYVYDFQHILYFLTEAVPATPYIFGSHHLTQLAHRDPEVEMRKIIDRRPRNIITGTEPALGNFGKASYILDSALRAQYDLIDAYPLGPGSDLKIYLRRP